MPACKIMSKVKTSTEARTLGVSSQMMEAYISSFYPWSLVSEPLTNNESKNIF
jgi:hypothetical protein